MSALPKIFRIYLVKRQQRGREGVIKSGKWADVVYGGPLAVIWNYLYATITYQVFYQIRIGKKSKIAGERSYVSIKNER